MNKVNKPRFQDTDRTRAGPNQKSRSPPKRLDDDMPRKNSHQIEDFDSDYADDNIPDRKAIQKRAQDSVRGSVR